MSEMIERVARAIAVSDRFDPDELAKSDPHLVMKSYTQYARAAIEAMREPTEEMKVAGSIDPGSGGPDLGYETEVWQAMIDTALGKVDA